MHGTGNENHLIFLLVLDFLIDLHCFKTPAIENITFPVYFGTDACVTAKVMLELNLIGFGDFCLFVSGVSDL